MRKPSPEREPMLLRCRSRHLSSGRWGKSAATIPARAGREKSTSTVTANWLESGHRGGGGASKNGRKNMTGNLIPARPGDLTPVGWVRIGVSPSELDRN